jgi:titin
MTGYRVYLDRDGDGTAEESPYPGTGDESDPIDSNLNPSVLEYRQTGLATGTLFGFKLRAYNAKGSVYSDWRYIKAAAEAAIMTGIQQNIGAGSATTIVLTWSEPSTANLNGGTAVGYRVYRNAGGATDISATNDPTCGMSQSPAPQTCTITGLTPGEAYRIQMTTINDVGESEKSTAATFKAASVPAKMVSPTNSAAGQAPSLTFTWTAPSDQGSAIYSFKGELRLDEVPYSSVYTWTGGGTAASPYTGYSKQFTTSDSVGLIAAKRYQFRICGVNEMGDGDWSEWSSTTVAPRGVCVDAPITPTSLARSSSVVAAPGTVVLSWDAINQVSEAGGDQVSNVAYEVWGGAGAASTKLIRADPTTSSHSQSVPPGEIWKFKLRAYNSGGQYSAFTTDLELVSAAVPGQVGSLTLVSNSPSTVNMQWTVPSTNGGTPITSYETSFDNFATSTETVANTATTYVFTGRNNGALETFYVRPVNAVGRGPIVSASITVAGR